MNGRRSQSKAKTQDTRGTNPQRDDNNGRPKQGRNRKRDATSGVGKTSKMSEKSPRRRKDKRDRETATRPEDTLGEAVSGYRANVTAPSKSKKSKVKKPAAQVAAEGLAVEAIASLSVGSNSFDSKSEKYVVSPESGPVVRVVRAFHLKAKPPSRKDVMQMIKDGKDPKKSSNAAGSKNPQKKENNKIKKQEKTVITPTLADIFRVWSPDELEKFRLSKDGRWTRNAEAMRIFVKYCFVDKQLYMRNCRSPAEKKRLYDQGRALINKHIYGGNDVVTHRSYRNKKTEMAKSFRDYELRCNREKKRANDAKAKLTRSGSKAFEDLTEEEQSQCVPHFSAPPPYYTEDVAACFRKLAASGANTEATVTTSNSSKFNQMAAANIASQLDVELLHASTSSDLAAAQGASVGIQENANNGVKGGCKSQNTSSESSLRKLDEIEIDVFRSSATSTHKQTKEDRKEHERAQNAKADIAAMRRRKLNQAKRKSGGKKPAQEASEDSHALNKIADAIVTLIDKTDKTEHVQETNIDAMKEKLRAKLNIWKSLLDSGDISEDEYNSGRKKVLNQFAHQ